ncbi:MAG: CpXC domain-containing protein [Verrucomicrobia bacterium]|nr:CpXC domain-containing protein [Verrucomicrobiota bacterium]
MSAYINACATCLCCGNVFPIQQFTSVNATCDPHLKARLFNRDLITFLCPSCGIQSEAPHDILYHDMEQKLMIVHSTKDPQGISSISTLALDIGEELLPHYRLRIVTDWNHLIEKINVFDAGLDDLIFEAVKTQIWLKYSGTSSLAPDEFLAEDVMRDASGNLTYHFVDISKSTENAFEIDDCGMYEDLRNAIYNVYHAASFPHGEWVLVSQNSASERLSMLR